MKQKCKTCNCTSESEYCFRHKPRKQMSKVSSILRKKLDNLEEKHRNYSDQAHFFLRIWGSRPHKCEGCGKWLGEEPRSYMFDHLLEKSKYPDLKFEEENIMLVCLECHDNKTRGFLTDIVRERIKIVREKFQK